MALKRMDNMGIVVEDLNAAIDSLSSSASTSKGGP